LHGNIAEATQSKQEIRAKKEFETKGRIRIPKPKKHIYEMRKKLTYSRNLLYAKTLTAENSRESRL
jgi:hypothetical protein